MPNLNLEIKRLDDLSYPIFIEENLLENGELFNSLIKNKQVAIISNKTIAALYLEKIKANFKDKEVIEIILEDLV